MFTSRCDQLLPLVLATAALAGCDLEAAEPRFGVQLTSLEFNLYSEDMGIHPFLDVLADPRNPFADTGVSDEAKFEILAAGGNVGSFYAWATLLALGPNGESQFYAASSLESIYETGEVAKEQLPIVRGMAVRAYTAVLLFFPESVTFAANGVEFFRLATLAYRGIVRLGGIPPAGWVLVPTVDGGEEAVWASGGFVGGGS